MTVVQFPLLPIDSQRGGHLDFLYRAALALENWPDGQVVDGWASDPSSAMEGHGIYHTRTSAAYFDWECLPVRAWWHNDLSFEYEARHVRGQWLLVIEKQRGCSQQQFEDAMDALDKFISEHEAVMMVSEVVKRT
jgi:hypothetical protein